LMSPRKDSQRTVGRVIRIIAVAVLCGFLLVAYWLRDDIWRILSGPGRADVTVLSSALDQAYAAIDPRAVSSSIIAIDGHATRHDHVEISRDSSLTRANLEITRAAERAGGLVLYGLESSDDRGRKQGVTLGISDGDSIIRQIRLEKRIR
jgi:hypothetical protein